MTKDIYTNTEITFVKRKSKTKQNEVISSQEDPLILSLDQSIVIDSPKRSYKVLSPNSITVFQEYDRRKYKSIRKIEF